GSRVTSHVEPPPRAAWTDADDNQPAEINEGDFLERVLRIPFPYVDESESCSDGGEAEGGEARSAEGSVCSAGGGVVVRLRAGADGLFGFNVRGGGGAPVLVSR
ncbi:hypothetical protein O3G_MSEX000791, partial [Manduca sexta]